MRVRTRLGIDFGTSNTVAVLYSSSGDDPVRPLLFDGSPSLPSAVCRQPDGALLVGRDAIHTARRYPEAFEPHPKRLIDERTVLLGTAEVPVTDLIGAVLRRVTDEAARVVGGEPSTVVLTHPVTWAGPRRGVLRAAAATVGIVRPELVPEPVAAAHHFVRHAGSIATGSTVVVYDFGAGTFDASVLRRTPDGFTVLATEGRTDTGGLDIDAVIMAMLGDACGDPAAWARLTAPTTVDDRRDARQLWDDVRSAKEILSRAATTFIPVPALGVDVPLGRPQFETLVRPILERTVDVTARAVRAAGAGDPAAVFLVGGSSRIPLVATLLHRRFGVAPTVVDQPELVVAQGSVTSVVPDDQPTILLPPVPSNDTAESGLMDTEPVQAEPEPRRFSRRTVVTSAALGAAALATAGGFAYWKLRDDPLEHDYRGKVDEAAHGVEVIAFSPMLDVLVIGGSDAQVRFFDSTGFKSFGEPLTGHTDRVTAMAFNPDGNVLASADSTGLVHLWDSSRRSLVGSVTYADGIAVNALAFSPNGRLIAAGGEDGAIRFWGVLTRAPDGEPLKANAGGVTSLAFSPVTGSLASGGRDTAVMLWETADRLRRGTLGGHSGAVQALAFHPDGRTLASAGQDSTVRVWDTSAQKKTGDPLQHGNGSGVDDVLFTPDGRTVISVSDRLRVRFWDTGTHDRAGADIPVAATRLALTSAGTMLAAASTSDVSIYDISR